MRNDTARRQAGALLENWDREFGFFNAKDMLGDWAGQVFARPYETLLKERARHQGFLETSLAQNDIFDCLMIARWRPNENALSDALAGLLDPGWGHDFAAPILGCVLDKMSAKIRLSKLPDWQRRQATLKRIKARLAGANLNVRRESSGENSRADIHVFANDFLLCIEHKIRGGKETGHASGKTQTRRLLEDARTLAGTLGIAPDNVAAILLSPEGGKPGHDEFVPLSFAEFADAAAQGVREKLGLGTAVPAAAGSILGFMSFYGRKL